MTLSAGQATQAVLDRLNGAVGYYEKRCASARWKAKLLRYGGLLSLSVTALWPAIQLIGVGQLFSAYIMPDHFAQIGYFFSAFGAILLLLDQRGGFSKAWARYSIALVALQCLRNRIQFASGSGEDVVAQISHIIQGETETWAKDYLNDLQGLQQALHSAKNSGEEKS